MRRAAAVLLALMAPAAAAQERPGAMDLAGSGLTPAEARDLRLQNAHFAQQYGLTERTLDAICLVVLGRRGTATEYASLVSRIEARATRAAALTRDLTALKAKVATLTGPVRIQSDQALADAQTAFAGGHLREADTSLARLGDLRQAGNGAARTAWLDAVDARAGIAETQEDFAGAKALHLSAEAELARLGPPASRLRWQQRLAAAGDDEQQGKILGDNEALRRAIAAYRGNVLALAPRADRPDDWARTQYDLGEALLALGERDAGGPNLQAVAAAFMRALEVRTADRVPVDWATTQNGLGMALARLGEREQGTATLRRAVEAYKAALLIRTRARLPQDWAKTQSNLADTLLDIGEREGDVASLSAAMAAFRAALEVLTRDRVPYLWATVQSNIGNAYLARGEREVGIASFVSAVAAYRAALEVRTRDHSPLSWAATQIDLGIALSHIGARESDVASLRSAVAAYQAGLGVLTADGAPHDWASTQNNLGTTLLELARRDGSIASARASVDAYRAALTVYDRGDDQFLRARTARNLALAEALVAQRQR